MKYFFTQKLLAIAEERKEKLSPELRKQYGQYLIEQLKAIKKKLNLYKKVDRVKAVHDIIDLTMESLLASTSSFPPCNKGCSYCCYIHVVCSYEEALQILAYTKLHDIPIDIERARIQGRVCEGRHSTKEEVKRMDDEYLKIPYDTRACLFLKDNICQIYPVRPTRCRTHLSGEDTPEPCSTIDGNVRLMKMLAFHDLELIQSAYDGISSSNSLPIFMLELSK